MVEIRICPKCGSLDYHETCYVTFTYYAQKNNNKFKYVRDEGLTEYSDCDVYCLNCGSEMEGYEVDDEFAVRLLDVEEEERVVELIRYFVGNGLVGSARYLAKKAFKLRDDEVIEAVVKLIAEGYGSREIKAVLKLI